MLTDNVTIAFTIINGHFSERISRIINNSNFIQVRLA